MVKKTPNFVIFAKFTHLYVGFDIRTYVHIKFLNYRKLEKSQKYLLKPIEKNREIF